MTDSAQSTLLNYWVYDEETYPNCFTLAITRSDGKHERCFEVSEFRNDVDKLMNCIDYLIENTCSMVGFNNLGFDYPILHQLYQMYKAGKLPSSGLAIAKIAYNLAQAQIDSMKGDGFASTIPEDEWVVPQVDLYKIWHFDNKAKATSLKMLEVNMRSDNVEDLPYPVGSTLTQEQIVNLKKYNLHDIRQTLKFFHISKDQISFREQLTAKYNRNFMNHNDTKIGKDYFVMRLQEEGVATHKMEGNRRKMLQTKRSHIKIKDCLFDYYDFKRPEFIAVFEWFKNQRITETKGVFADIDESRLGDVAKYAEMQEKREKFKAEPTEYERAQFMQEHPCGWIESVELKATYVVKHPDGTKEKKNKLSWYGCWREASNLNVVVNGFRFDFGTGGIHGSLSSKIARATKSYRIVDADVASMYPNIAIANKVYPEHLSEKFCEIYEDVYNQRKSYPKGSAENAMLKLALNGVYGDSNNQFSVFYDPMYTMKITINGQLSLCLLAEKLMEIPDLKIIQVNTDGITVAIKEETREQYDAVCKAWQQQVGLELEFADYSKMIIRDVNNYIAVYTNGKVKRKGAYQYEGLGWHQNHGGLVIPMAAEAYMLHGTPVEDFVKNHKNNFDFMLRTKVPRSSKLVMEMPDGVVVEQQNICRYYPCKSGGKLVKIMPPGKNKDEDRYFQIDGEWNLKTCNNVLDFTGDVDYDYYIKEANKLIIE